MRIVHLLISICFLTACQTERDELVGHWHSIPVEDGFYWTLDITDSTTQVDKYRHSYRQQEFSRTFNYKGEESIVFDYEEYKDFGVRNDTLFIGEYLKFTRVDEDFYLNDHFPASLVRLNLPRSTPNSKTNLPYRKSQLTDIYVGPPKGIVGDDITINPDSTIFQTWDVLAGYEDLAHFAQVEDDKLHKDVDFWLIIHADSITSQITIDSIRTILEPVGVVNGFIISRYNYELDRIEYEELNSR